MLWSLSDCFSTDAVLFLSLCESLSGDWLPPEQPKRQDALSARQSANRSKAPAFASIFLTFMGSLSVLAWHELISVIDQGDRAIDCIGVDASSLQARNRGCSENACHGKDEDYECEQCEEVRCGISDEAHEYVVQNGGNDRGGDASQYSAVEDFSDANEKVVR